jgi:exodeoxyribonuclease VII large subunit
VLSEFSPPSEVLSVLALTRHIKRLLETDGLLSGVWVKGEVSNFRQVSSGHCYFTLKEDAASIKAVIWRTAAARMILPRDGELVVAHGAVSVYEQQGVYQLVVDHLQASGAGRFWLEFERLRARLEAEGLFDADRKRPLPAIPRRIGVVTSASGAALRDILRTMTARYPAVEVVLAPTAVQGVDAPLGIVSALEMLNRWSASGSPLDAIILARGGGSIEDLLAFNDERVARAIAMSAAPVVCGVGHETDFTIADFVADLRAATPTAAAALATPDSQELRSAIADLFRRLLRGGSGRIASERQQIRVLRARLERTSPVSRLAQDRLALDQVQRRAALAGLALVRQRRNELSRLQSALEALDPARVLERGYALVTDAAGSLVTSVAQVQQGDAVRVRVSDGAFDAQVGEIQA